jgi:hypothetical protein
MFETKRTPLTGRLADAVDLIIDFATLGQYGLEPAYEKGPPRRAAQVKNRRRPTLPGGCPPSTIGAERLNCSVRNGKRCLPLAMRHRKYCETAPVELENRTRPQGKNIRQALDPLVPVG